MPDGSLPEPGRAGADARLAAIVESSDDAIVSKTLDGIIQTWNKGAERIFGWTAEEVIGKSITIIIPPERLHEEPEILDRMRRGQRVEHFETVRQTKQGKLIHVSVTISPVRDASGRVVGVSKVARDITAQTLFHEQLQAAKNAADEARASAERAREDAEKANRAKDHFLSVLSHELRTPLTPVLAALSLLEHDSMVPSELREAVAMMRRNVETEARLLDDLLDLTRIARGKVQLRYEAVDAHAVLRNVLSILDTEIEEKRLTVTMSLRAREPHIWADAARFQQILLNLLSNAVKFTPDEGTVTIRTCNENGTIKIEIADTGIGIEPEVLPRLFRPFEQGEQTVTRQFGGLGLGLSIVKSLVEMHKASITAASEGRGKGATFVLRIETVRSGEANRSAAARSSTAHKGYRVLLVEDHEDTRQVLSRLLTSFGCIVTSAGSVKEAIAAAESQTFDLLLSDIGLPDGTGMDVMKHVAAKSKVPGIALSGFGQDEDLRRSREAGFVTHLTKPISVQTLREVLKTVAP